LNFHGTEGRLIFFDWVKRRSWKCILVSLLLLVDSKITTWGSTICIDVCFQLDFPITNVLSSPFTDESQTSNLHTSVHKF